MIGRDDVKKAALLARIKLDEREADAIANDLERIVGHVDELMKVDVEGVAPMTHPAAVVARTRPDEVRAGDGRAALAASKGYDEETGLVRVPRVIE